MGGCCGNSRSGIRYEATFADGSKQTYATAGEAIAAIQRAEGGTYKAVAK